MTKMTAEAYRHYIAGIYHESAHSVIFLRYAEARIRMQTTCVCSFALRPRSSRFWAMIASLAGAVAEAKALELDLTLSNIKPLISEEDMVDVLMPLEEAIPIAISAVDAEWDCIRHLATEFEAYTKHSFEMPGSRVMYIVELYQQTHRFC